MSLDVATYNLRPVAVQAVQVTVDNLVEVAEWCGGFLDVSAEVIQIDEEDRGFGGYARTGDWVLRWEGDAFSVQPDHEDGWRAGFAEEWEPAPLGETAGGGS